MVEKGCEGLIHKIFKEGSNMKLNNKQAMVLIEIARATLNIDGLSCAYSRKQRTMIYNKIMSQQDEALKELE